MRHPALNMSPTADFDGDAELYMMFRAKYIAPNVTANLLIISRALVADDPPVVASLHHVLQLIVVAPSKELASEHRGNAGVDAPCLSM